MEKYQKRKKLLIIIRALQKRNMTLHFLSMKYSRMSLKEKTTQCVFFPRKNEQGQIEKLKYKEK